MRLFGFVLLAFPIAIFAQSSPSEPPRVEGRFEATAQYSIGSHRHVEIVVAVSDAEKERLGRLRQNGFVCQALPSATFRCEKAAAFETNEPSVTERVQRRFEKLQVRFYEPFSPSLVADGEVSKKWTVEQKVVLSRSGTDRDFERTLSFTDYYWLGGFFKLAPGGSENPAQDIFILNGEDLEIPATISVQPNRFQMDIYTVTVRMKRVEAK